MNTVTVDKAELLERLQSNREQHRETFLKAQEVYRQRMIEELDRALESARNGEKIIRAWALPEPEDHTDEYDQAIAMVQWEKKDSVVLDQRYFRQFVLDEWGWQHSFTANTEAYVTGAYS